jgi:glutaryl-CoA dehydrogenase (non-decarboxylating)
MDFELAEDQKILQQTVRDFAKKEIAPVVDADDKTHKFQREIVTQMGELGFFGCPIPEEYGGNDMGFLSHVIVCEEISRVSSSLGAAFNMQTMGTSRTILEYGTEEQKKKYIPKLVSAEWLGCFAITEPDTGSDTASMTSTAVKDGDSWVLNGTKTWITYSEVSDVGVIFAYTDRSAKHRGMSAFIVDMHTPGITTSGIDEKLGWHSAPTGEIVLENARIPEGNLLGNLGQGFAIMMADFNNTRLTAAARAIGSCQTFIDEAVKYATQREQFGQQIGQFQMVQEVIGRMIVETEAARLLVYRCAGQKDQGMLNNTLETSMAKYYASDVASRAADDALRVLGAWGWSSDYPVERHLRDAKLHQILEGSANIHKMIIATDALGYRKANR